MTTMLLTSLFLRMQAFILSYLVLTNALSFVAISSQSVPLRCLSSHTYFWSNTRHTCLNSDSEMCIFNLHFAVTRASTRSRLASTMTWSFKSAKTSWRKALFCFFVSSSTCSLVLAEYLHHGANPGNSRVMCSSRGIFLDPDSIAVSLVFFSARMAIATTFFCTTCIWSSISVSIIFLRALVPWVPEESVTEIPHYLALAALV